MGMMTWEMDADIEGDGVLCKLETDHGCGWTKKEEKKKGKGVELQEGVKNFLLHLHHAWLAIAN